MRIIFIFIFILSPFLYAVDIKKDVDFGDLFNQLDKVISAKKNTKVIKKEKKKHIKTTTTKREKNYKKFNEAAKKYHIFRAKKILKTVKKLIVKYKNKNKSHIDVQRYSSIGNEKFAYVSGVELNKILSYLNVNAKILKRLHNYKELLDNIKEYDIKTIAKVLIIVEQEIMNLMDMGVKRIDRKIKRRVVDIPKLLRLNKVIQDVKIVFIDKKIVKLESVVY